MRPTYALCAARKSETASPPNFSMAARANAPNDARLRDDSEGLDGGDVASVHESLRGLARLEVGGAERARQASAGSHGRANDDLLPVRDACFDPPRGSSPPVARLVATISSWASLPRRPASAKPPPISTPFTACVPMSVAAQAPVETRVLRRVGAEARQDPACAHLDQAAHGIAIRPRLVDRALQVLAGHPSLDRGPDLTQERLRDRPAATIAAVCRALARSSASRASARPSFMTPARSAWPGRGA